MLGIDHTVQQHKKTNVYCPCVWRALGWREQSWCPGSRCRLKSTKHKYLVSWRMTGTIQLSYLGIRTLEQTQGGRVSFLDIPPASTEQIPQFFGNQTHRVAIQGKDESWPLVIVRSWMVTMETAIISLAENRVTLTIIGHCPLMMTAENSNTGHGAAYKLRLLWWSMNWLCSTIQMPSSSTISKYKYKQFE